MKALPAATRHSNTERKYAQIREQFRQQFTDQPRPRRFTREYIISVLALKWCLSMGTIENILYTKPATAETSQAHEAALAA